MLVQAQQVTPDAGAPATNRPGIGAAPNGVPLVDIVTPNGQGLSHNKYGNFNVGNPGLILNNHNGEFGTSKLGGVTPGNPNLRNSGPASVILNEVTSGDRSALEGPTEVFGGRADVIIANPNGITCDGCGFINTPRATLTTGAPDIDGSGRLSGFTVRGGDVTFGSRGGNFASGDGAVDLFDIVSRTVRIDGPVVARNLRLSAGRQKFDYATGEARAIDGIDDAGEFAIDGSALGAMQADRIRIVVTDKGAGVRMRSDMAANAGELTLSADGRISLGNASGRDGVNIQSKSRQVEAKKLTSKKRVTVKADKGITLEAVAAEEDVILGSGDGLLSVAGDVAALGHVELTSSGAISAGGVSAGKSAVLAAGQGITAGQVIADGAASLATATGNIALSGTARAGGGDLMLEATSGAIAAAALISFNNMTLTAGTDIASGDILSGGALVASARSLKATSAVSGIDFAATNAANGAISLGTTGDMRLQMSGGAVDVASLLSAGNLNVSAGSVIGQNITSHGAVAIAGNTNVSGQLLGAGDVSITGANIMMGAIISGVDSAASKASPNGAIVVGRSGDIALQAGAGAIDAGTLLSAGNLVANAGTFNAGNVTAHGTADIMGTTTISGQLLSGSDIVIKGSSINIGTVVAGVDLAALDNGNVVPANAAHALNLTATAGDLTADRLLSPGNMVASATGNLSANALSHGILDLTAGGTLTLSGQSLAGGNATLKAGSIDIDTLVSGVDFAATEQSGGSLILKTGLAGTGQMLLDATDGSIIAGELLSGGDLTAHALRDISYDSLQSFAGADLRADQGSISLDNKTAAKGNITLTLQSLDLSNDRGKLATAGTLTVNADSANFSGSTLTFGGISLNLTNSADVSGSKVRAVTADGGSGDIAISAKTIATTSATALLAANDLTLTLASLNNTGQLAAGRDLAFNISGNLTNTASGLIYAGNDGRFHVAGDLLNDQGAILVGHDLAIAADANGGRNRSITNVSGLIRAGNDVSIVTENLTNKRLTDPTWSTVQLSSGVVSGFVLNPDVAGKPFAYLYSDNPNDKPQLYPGFYPPLWSDYESQLWSLATLADGTSYHAWTWTSANGPVGQDKIYDWIRQRVPKDGNGVPILDPTNPSRYFVVAWWLDGPADTSTTYTWDETSNISQSVHEDRFDGPLAPEALIRAGGNLSIDATTLNNSYSSIEAAGDAVLKGQVLNNEGVTLSRTTTTTCNALGACEAYDADGNRDPSKDIAQGTSIISKVETVGFAAGNIKAGGALDISGFNTVNNTSTEGSIAGHVKLAPSTTPGDPTSALAGLTAGGALFTPSAALGGLLANGMPLVGADLVAALGNSAPKPNSGGFGGTIPGQVFLYETRAEFLDVSKFYGSGYFISRIGYRPEREVPFLGDAYFENQLIDQQLRQLVNQGLGKGSFIPGSDAIEQMKTLLDRGADFANANGLAIGQQLSPEMIAGLTETLVWYEKKTVNGIEVLVPTVYVANADKAGLTVAGALISGGSVNMNVGNVANSGAIAAKTDLRLAATTISATGGSFKAGGNLSLAASQNLTLTAQTLTVGGQNVVNPNAMVTAGGDAALQAGDTLKLQGTGVDVGGNAMLAGRDVTLETQKVENDGSQNATGTRINTGGDLGIKAKNNVTVIGSAATAGGALDVTAENGSVNIATVDVTRKSDDGYSKATTTTQQASQLSSGTDTTIKAGDDILLSGSKLKADGDARLEAGNDINITAAQEQESVRFGKNSSSSTTHTGSGIEAGGSISARAGTNGNGDLNVIGSKLSADGTVDLGASDNVTIAEARDSAVTDTQGSFKSGSGFSRKKGQVRGHIETETAAGSSISGGAGVDITSGGDTTISASRVQAGTGEKKADLNIDAGGDLVIASGKDTVAHDDREKSKGFLSKGSISTQSYNETTVASELGAAGNVNLNAGDNAVIAGSKVVAGEAITVEGDSVSVIGAAEQHERESESKKSGLGVGSGGGFLSLWGKEGREKDYDATLNAGSSLSAGTDVNIKARDSDVNVIGSDVEAGRDIALDAARDVNITPGAEAYASHEKEEKSGFGIQFGSSGSGFSVGIGAKKTKDELNEGAATNAGSRLQAGRDITINAGRDANLQAAEVAADRDVAITAERDVNLLAAQDKSNYEAIHEELFAGVTVAVGSGLVSAAQSVGQAAEKIGDVSDKYSAANAAFASMKAYDALDNLANGGSMASVSVTAGFTHQKSSTSSSSEVPVVTTVTGGRSVSIEAKSGDINSHGAQIAAGYDSDGLLTDFDDEKAGDVSLKAGKDINLESAQARNETSSKTSSSGASIGVSVGVGLNGVGVSPTGGAYASAGRSNASGTTQVNTHVTGTGDIKLESGRDTNLKGAVVSGETVTADVGRDLNIISVPDTGEAKNSSVSAGFSLSGPGQKVGSLGDLGGAIGSALGTTPSISGVQPGFGTGSGETNWISEQSGLISSGKMEVTVGGNTHLGAGKIVSESGDLTLDTGTLTHENFSGSKQYEGFDVQANIDTTGGKGTLENALGNTTAEGSYKRDDTRQEVRATVGEGEITIRDKDKQAALEAEGKTEDLAALNRDPDKAYEVTRDEHVEIEYYLSSNSLKAAAGAVEVVGKTIGQALEVMSAKLAASGDLTAQELETAKKVAKALDDGTLDLKQLISCSGRQGFNLMDWIVGTAHASTGCSLFDNAGKKIADLTPDEREACIQMISSLMEKYANEYLTGGKEPGGLPGSVHTIAEALRSIGSDEQLVAGAQALGMSASFIRDVSIRLALGEEGYRDFQREIEPLAAAGQLTREAAARAIENIAAAHGLSPQETKDLKLVAGVTTAAILGLTKVSGVGRSIAFGHAFEKHVLQQGEFAGLNIRTREQFVKHIENVMDNPTAVRQLDRGRIAYWHEETRTIVITNPNASDGGTAFQPTTGRDYFDKVK
ncbi:hemagglutinin repeat-containing protein [Phyllobacterium phragmitis]